MAEIESPAASGDVHAGMLVLGAGPGGYTAAFRAADLGQSVVLADQRPALGGVCLNVGCIPSKALLHAARVIAETREMAAHGVRFGDPDIDLDALRGWKDGVVSRLTGGLAGLARQRKVTTLRGTGRFVAANLAEVTAADGSVTTVSFASAIIAAGSSAVRLPFMPDDDPRVLDSTGALDLASVPGRLLVIGGGIIGLEMAAVYHELGARVTVVELMDQLIPGADRDIVAPLAKRIKSRYENIYLTTKVTGAEAGADPDAGKDAGKDAGRDAGRDAGTGTGGLRVSFDGPGAPDHDVFDQVLVAVGRVPNGRLVGAENAGVLVDDRGYIPVDKQQRTNVPHIFAIGDVVGPPMLAHKATHEGRVAAEVAAGQRSYFDARVIPSVAYTDPEVAWAGVTETEARAAGVPYGKGVFPWAASGRALSLGRDEGLTKLLFDPASKRLIGAGLVGPNAGELVAETAHAIEMGADAADIALTIHPHPTLSETVGLSAEAFEGTITDLYLPKKKK
jgi:dihydrolipoamide dehydrogenase